MTRFGFHAAFIPHKKAAGLQRLFYFEHLVLFKKNLRGNRQGTTGCGTSSIRGNHEFNGVGTGGGNR